jgi:AcrR family transcriptional regulator
MVERTRVTQRRATLSRERIVTGAVQVADRGGLGQVSMRNVGKELGVEAMSLYHHFAGGKAALLDALVDWVFAQVGLPEPGRPWRPAMASRATSARRVLAQHPWALGLIESRRTPGTALLRHHDAVLGCLRRNGFSVALASHAFSAIDAYVYGFVLTEVNRPFDTAEGVEEMAAEMQQSYDADSYPHLFEMITTLVVGQDYDYANEFGYGLDLVLDSLERRLDEEQSLATAQVPDATPREP